MRIILQISGKWGAWHQSSRLAISDQWEGPQWLREQLENYPKVQETKEVVKLLDECTEEMRVKVQHQDGTTLTSVAVEKIQDNEVSKVRNLQRINCKHFSDNTGLFRITALVFKFVALLRATRQQQQLGLYKDENQCLKYSETRHPILLPREHHLTKLIVEHCHKEIKRRGVKDTLAELRNHYWIPKGRQFVKKVLN